MTAQPALELSRGPRPIERVRQRLRDFADQPDGSIVLACPGYHDGETARQLLITPAANGDLGLSCPECTPDEVAEALGFSLDELQPARALRRSRRPRFGEPMEEAIDRLDQEYALVLLGDKPVVLRETEGTDGRPEVRFLSLSGFHDWLQPEMALANGRLQQVSKAFVKSRKVRRFEGITFDPSGNAPEGWYNLWKGFAIEPSEDGSCQLFLDHILENVCDGNEHLYEWVMGWFAHMVQKPTEKLGNALVLRGQQGTGKTIVGETIGSLLGGHYALVADSRYIVGRFNSHLANCLLLQLDEATWGGDRTAEGKLKDLVTGDYQYIEFKGKEPIRVRNYVHLLVTGNNNWLVPAGLEERRFCVLDVAEHRRQDHKYFQAIADELNAGGRAKLLHYLLHYDLTDIPLRRIPRTTALLEQKVASLTLEQTWWLGILRSGTLPGDAAGSGETPKEAIWRSFLACAEDMKVGRRSSETMLGIALKRLAPGVTTPRKMVPTPAGSERRYFYKFPPLAACRRHFEQVMGDADWPDNAVDAEWTPDPRSSP